MAVLDDVQKALTERYPLLSFEQTMEGNHIAIYGVYKPYDNGWMAYHCMDKNEVPDKDTVLDIMTKLVEQGETEIGY